MYIHFRNCIYKTPAANVYTLSADKLKFNRSEIYEVCHRQQVKFRPN